MTPIGTCRLYRPDPASICVGEQWGKVSLTAALTPASLVVSVRGEVDASNAGRLADYVERRAAVAAALIVDTSAVDFLSLIHI